jgi:RNA polymerase sigma-70 factor (ECF subfamily)
MELHVHVNRRKNADKSPEMTKLATLEDGALIKLALDGQTDGFTVLTERYVPALKRRIRLIVPNITEVDDLLQEVLLKSWHHLSTFRSESTFRTWMTRIAVNEALNFHRRAGCRPICHTFDDFDTFASREESQLQSLTRAEAIRAVREAVVELPAKYRQILILREFEQLSVKEIAQLVHLRVPTVKTRLFRARHMLKRSRIRYWALADCSSLVDAFDENLHAA